MCVFFTLNRSLQAIQSDVKSIQKSSDGFRTFSPLVNSSVCTSSGIAMSFPSLGASADLYPPGFSLELLARQGAGSSQCVVCSSQSARVRRGYGLIYIFLVVDWPKLPELSPNTRADTKPKPLKCGASCNNHFLFFHFSLFFSVSLESTAVFSNLKRPFSGYQLGHCFHAHLRYVGRQPVCAGVSPDLAFCAQGMLESASIARSKNNACEF